MNIVVIGAGAWGTALACKATSVHRVALWARDANQASQMKALRSNEKYLPGIPLPSGLNTRAVSAQHLDAPAEDDLRAADLVVLATPAAATPQWLTTLAASHHIRAGTPVVWLSKGLVWRDNQDAAQLLHEVAAELAPQLLVGALSGPSFAQEVARGLPCALVAASPHERVRSELVSAFHDSSLRIYANSDLLGVELGGAVKNVLAIAAGVSDGLGLGFNARAALLTRGLAEMTRLGIAMGARADTFMGLSGMGDLLLTATGDLSRNRRVGLELAQGKSLSTILSELGHVAEGVFAAPAILTRARRLSVAMPMTEAVNELLLGHLSPFAAAQRLMQRDPVAESKATLVAAASVQNAGSSKL